MGRGGIPKERTRKLRDGLMTFCTRRRKLFKKAHELAVLCDAQVALVIFSKSGEMCEFSSPSSSVKTILEQYTKIKEKTSNDKPYMLHAGNHIEENSEMALQNFEHVDQKMLNELEKQLCTRLGHVREIKNQKILEQIEELYHLKVEDVLHQKNIHMDAAGKDDVELTCKLEFCATSGFVEP